MSRVADNRSGRHLGLQWLRCTVIIGAICSAFDGSAATAQSAAASAGTTAFVDVTVIPMDRERTLLGQTVLVQHGRIRAVGPVDQVQVPAGATRIDGHGKFLLPGLADMDTHLSLYDSVTAERALLLWLANGVTTIRNLDYLPVMPPGTKSFMPLVAELNGPSLLRLRARSAAGEVLGPRIYTSGPWGGNVSQPGMSSTRDTPEAVQRLVAAYKTAGYDFLTIHDEDSTLYASLVAAAHTIGMPVVGHVPSGVPLTQVFAAHQRSIEHLTGYDQEIDSPSEIPALVAATTRAAVWNCPTQLFDPKMNIPALEQRPEWRYLSARTRIVYERLDSMVTAQRAFKRARVRGPVMVLLDSSPDWFIDSSRVLFEDSIINRRDPYPARNEGRTSPTLAQQLIKALQDSGAPLLVGTDAPLGGLMPGFAIHRELEALVQAGLTPYQALVTGTRNPAIYFGTLDTSGTVTVNKRADLMLVEGNPLTDIRNTARLTGVMIGGRWVSRAQLDHGLAECIGQVDDPSALHFIAP